MKSTKRARILADKSLLEANLGPFRVHQLREGNEHFGAKTRD